MKHTRLLITLILFVTAETSIAQTPDWKWAKGAAGEEFDQASAVVTDNNGNVYVAGYFSSISVAFGSVTLNNNGVGFDDLFLAKYDSSGNLLWARSAGGSSDDKATALATDASGNLYLTGYFYSPTIAFDTFTLNNAGAVGDILLVKYSPAGDVLWAKREGGPALEIPYSVLIDGSDNIVVAGRFSSLTVTFDTVTLTQAGSMDVFVVKYNSAGNVLWAQGAGGGSNDEAYSIAADASDNIYVGGYFNQNAHFGSTTLTTEGISDIFIAKCDAATGNFLWAKRAGGDGDDRATAIALDNNANIYAAGFFQNDSITFGSTTLADLTLDNTFIVKFDNNGNPLWAHGFGAKSRAEGLAFANGSVYVCGTFKDDTLVYGSSTLLINGSTDFYLVKCDAAGNAQWATKQTSGGESGENAYAVTADAQGNIVIAGNTDSEEITFSGSSVFNDSNGFDMFVARLGGAAVGINDKESRPEVLAYPNPATGYLIVEAGHPQVIRFYDLFGKEVFTAKLQQGKNRIELNAFTAGVYFYHAERQSGKVVVAE